MRQQIKNIEKEIFKCACEIMDIYDDCLIPELTMIDKDSDRYQEFTGIAHILNTAHKLCVNKVNGVKKENLDENAKTDMLYVVASTPLYINHEIYASGNLKKVLKMYSGL